ncbi:MAG: STAS domain-containing protein [Gemmatimonadales bacterium]|nr:MAG: STAS domain-containing protein [Gemmatimonadales bacterium]
MTSRPTPDPREGPSPPGVRHEADTLVVELAGDWELSRTIPRFDAVLESDPALPEPRAVDFDAADLGNWDSSLLAFLLQGMIHCEAHEMEFRSTHLPEDIAGLLELARAVPEQGQETTSGRASLPSVVGTRGIAAWDGFMAAVTFLGEVSESVLRLLLLRLRMRWRDFWVVVQANSSGALPIVTLIAFLVGMIISFLGAVVLRRFGAGYFVSYLVGYGMLREMASLMTGIIMAGRTGTAFAAELGSMKISEEIDAYRTLGISPVDHLVLPRVLGLLVTMPLLTIYAGFVGILGGMVVAIMVLDLTATQFLGGLLSAVTLPDALLGVFKGTVFGLIIGLAGCMKGMQTGSDASAVGKAATSAAVLGITLIIAANAVIDWLAVLLNI